MREGTLKQMDLLQRCKEKKLNVSKTLKTWASLVELDQFDLDHWDQTLEIYKDTDVYEHLLRLASGLESLVVGKDEIVEEFEKINLNCKRI